MATFTVHVPRDTPDPAARAERVTFVRDGFSTAAFLFGPLYLIRHRAWLAAAAWIVAVIGGGWLCHGIGLPDNATVGLLLLAMLFTGLEASSIRRFALFRRGLDVAAVVGGRNIEEGERSFFRDAVARSFVPVPPPGGRSFAMPPSGVIGDLGA